MEEFSINLRPLFEVPLRWWRVVVTSVSLFTILGILINMTTLLTPDVYQATAGVAIIKSRTEVSLNTAVRTLSEEDLIEQLGEGQEALFADNDARRQTLVNLVSNGTIAERVLDELQNDLLPVDLQPGRLAQRVTGGLANQGDSDLITIDVVHPDPVIAAQIANAWAAAYEDVVNEVYTRPSTPRDLVLGDVERARQEYIDAQEALIQSLSENRVAEAERQIREKRQILDVLRGSRQRAISTTINFQIERDAELYTSYLAAQSANRLMAFQKEQDRKRSLVAAYIDTQTNAQLSVFRQQAQDRQRILDAAYGRKARLENLIDRARTLQRQAEADGDGDSAALALALLKMDVAGVLDNFAVNELSLLGVQELAPEDYAADTASLVAALEAELEIANQTITEQRDVLLNDDELVLLEAASGTELDQLIAERYPQLFETGELARLSTAVLEDNALERSALLIAEDLLQLRGRQGLLNFTSANTPLNNAISDMEAEIRSLQAQVERDQGLQTDLVRARNLAFETYSTLARKAAEIDIADRLPGTDVRFAARATVPVQPANQNDRLIGVALMMFLGILFGLLAAVLLEFIRPNGMTIRLFGPPAAPWNRAATWVATPLAAIEPVRKPQPSNQGE